MRSHVLVVLLALLVFAPIAHASRPGPSLAESVAKCAHVLTDGYAQLYGKGVTATYGTLPVGYGHDQAAVVLFTMESWNLGNSYRQFLAVFLRNPQLQRAQPIYPSKWRLAAIAMVGRDGVRVFQVADIDGASIKLSGLSWTKGDPMSHPTGVAHATYAFAPYSLTEVTAPTAARP